MKTTGTTTNYVPNKRRAITSGKIATIVNGKRQVDTYKAGEPLKGGLYNGDNFDYNNFKGERNG